MRVQFDGEALVGQDARTTWKGVYVIKPKDIGATARMLRTELGISATALAKKVGISQPQITRLENGQHGFRSGTLVKLARALKVPPFRLLMTEKEWRKWSKR